MTRSRYANNAQTHDGLPVQIIPNAQVTVYEAGTTTPLAATLYAGATGGTTLTNPFFSDAHGNFEFYLDAGQDIKIVATGVGSGTLTADYERVLPAVSSMVFKDANDTLAVSRNSATYPTAIFKNTNAAGIAFEVDNLSGTAFIRAGRSSGNDFLIMGGLASPTALSTLVASVTKSAAHVTADFGLVSTAASPDSGAMRGIAATATGGGSVRAGEFHTLVQTGAGAGARYGVEIGIASQVASGSAVAHNGIYLSSETFGLTGTVRNDTGLLITGSEGWKNPIRVLDTNGTTVLFNVNQLGTVTSGHYVPAAANIYSLGDGVNNWAAVYVDTCYLAKKVAAPATPASGYSSIAPSTSEYWQIATSGAVVRRILDAGAFTAAGQLLSASASNTVSVVAAGTSSQILHGGTSPSFGSVVTADITANAVTNRILNYTESTDVLSGAAMTAGVWLDVIANQNFTVADASSTVELICRAGAIISSASVGALFAARLVIDSAGTPQNIQIGSNILQVASQYASPMNGNASAFVTGLSAAVHTVKLQFFSSQTATAYCRTSSFPNSEYVNMTVVEHKR